MRATKKPGLPVEATGSERDQQPGGLLNRQMVGSGTGGGGRAVRLSLEHYNESQRTTLAWGKRFLDSDK